MYKLSPKFRKQALKILGTYKVYGDILSPYADFHHSQDCDWMSDVTHQDERIMQRIRSIISKESKGTGSPTLEEIRNNS